MHTPTVIDSINVSNFDNTHKVIWRNWFYTDDFQLGYTTIIDKFIECLNEQTVVELSETLPYRHNTDQIYEEQKEFTQFY